MNPRGSNFNQNVSLYPPTLLLNEKFDDWCFWSFPYSIPLSPIAASITMKYDIQLVVCRDGKEFAKNWWTLTLRVKTCAEWGGIGRLASLILHPPTMTFIPDICHFFDTSTIHKLFEGSKIHEFRVLEFATSILSALVKNPWVDSGAPHLHWNY